MQQPNIHYEKSYMGFSLKTLQIDRRHLCLNKSSVTKMNLLANWFTFLKGYVQSRAVADENLIMN
jgi:hypothetical protein